MEGVEGTLKIWKELGTMVFFICILNGCAKPPDAKSENGLSYAKGDSEKEAEAFLENARAVSGYINAVEGGYQITCHLGEEENGLDIDAFVDDIYMQDVHPLTAKAGSLNQENICRTFFEQDDAEDITEKYLKELEAEIAKIPEEEREENQPYMEPVQEFYLQGTSGNRSFGLSGTSFNYLDNHLYMQYEDMCREEHNYGLTENIGKDFTIETAWDEVENVMKKIGMEDIKLVSCAATVTPDGEGFYDMEYTAIVSGIPILSRNQLILGYLCPYGDVEIGKAGIAEIDAHDLVWEQINVMDESVMSAEDMLAVLSQYVSDNKIAYTQGVTYDACELVYIINTQDWQTAVFQPAWHLYAKQPYPSGQEEGMLFGIDTEVKEILISATTGEVIPQW
ncbi:MAG: hypothetical protein K2L07_14480 [Lachnospiraceae bacterium]|nr:hypothetical protein [Lachnospiraceae bacterium]